MTQCRKEVNTDLVHMTGSLKVDGKEMIIAGDLDIFVNMSSLRLVAALLELLRLHNNMICAGRRGHRTASATVTSQVAHQ